MTNARRLILAVILATCSCANDVPEADAPGVDVSGVDVPETDATSPETDDAGYRAAWQEGMEAFTVAAQGFVSGVCNIGGDQQQCHAVSADMIDALNAFLDALIDAEVPAEFVDGDDAVRSALTDMRDGLEQRNRGFELQSNEDFRAGNDKMEAGLTAFFAAYQLFPEGARPEPAPTL